MKRCVKLSLILTPAVLIFSFGIFTTVRAVKISQCDSAVPLTYEQELELNSFLKTKYSSRNQILKTLPYTLTPSSLELLCESAIVIDTSNGNILYEKNSDQIIPPASMTKLFSMYVVDNAVAQGKISYQTEIVPPKESWACNMPPHSSLMFLGNNQKLSVAELLSGLSVASGNDAAYALAYILFGNMDDFVQAMNQTADYYGLKNTHFVESSGYSELNRTTAREMAAFSTIYINQHPESLENFHSLQSFTYPKQSNLTNGYRVKSQDFSEGFPETITMPITQRNTNPLLGVMDGCDGLKTGYIDESGYNLALTAKRHGTRFLSVTMKGPGKNPKDGNEGRIHDGKVLMDWAFSSFADYKDMTRVKPYFLRTCGGKEIGVQLVPAFNPGSITVPFIKGESPEDSVQNVKVVTNIPSYLKGDISYGDVLGSVDFILEDYTLDSVPLVADRTVKKSNFLVRLADKIIYALIESL
ncbi:MAG: D-alanyl-D-alanine carboxypeptidase [Treponema sp.]|nr:D-alanyl-D-alanine carboxypeptidase [Treponema sp.]